MKSTEKEKKTQNFLFNFFTSGKYTEKSEFGISDYFIRFVLLNFTSLAGSVILLGFIILRAGEGKFGSVATYSVMLLIAVLTMVFSRMKSVPQVVPALTLMIFYGLLCVVITWLGEAYGSNFLFIYLYPPITIILLGMRLGIILSAILCAVVSLEMLVPGLSRYSYPVDLPIHMLVTYLMLFAVMVTIEVTRKTKDRMIEAQRVKLEELKEVAESASRAKNNFLANMSHEIRTPINAITGSAELLLRGNASEDSRRYAQDIKHASLNLISIINDILDFSKIEAGKLEMVEAHYMLSSLINDAICMIRMQLMEKPVFFYTNIDVNIPNSLIGDEERLRQILLNVLSNAVKFTEKGHISFSVKEEKRQDNKIWLSFTVSDTGQGIRTGEKKKVFGDFGQVDTKRDRSIEGTGLGLAITKRLCLNMGGDITFQSEYNKGSSFTVSIPQGIYSEEPFALVENAAGKRILLYEERAVYAKSLNWSLDNMKVPHTLTEDYDAFREALSRDEWFFVFAAYGLYEKVKPLMELPNESFRNGKKPQLALAVEWGTENYISDVRFVSLPIQSLSIANILNGKVDKKNYFGTSDGFGTVRFTIPQIRILVVDDIATNLKVTEALLSPYCAIVETSLNGSEAVQMVKRRTYDLIFMDHMMPEMDGIEAVALIREWEGMLAGMGNAMNAVPIIALTANAEAGIKEMFIEKGFTDFLAKPIDISKLDEILARWIPVEKREYLSIKKIEDS